MGSPCSVHATRDRKQSLRRKRDDGVGSKFVFATVTVRSGVPGNQSPGPAAACFTVEPFSRPFRTVLLGFYVFPFVHCGDRRPCSYFLTHDTLLPLGTRRFSCRVLATRNRPQGEDGEMQVPSPLSFYDLFRHRFNANSTQHPRNAKSNLFGKHAFRKLSRRWAMIASFFEIESPKYE